MRMVGEQSRIGDVSTIGVTASTTHIKETIKRNAAELLGRQEVQTLLDKFKETNPKVIEELIPNLMNLGKVQKVLQNLLKEQISIRDLRTILETLADYAPKIEDPEVTDWSLSFRH